MTEFITHVSYHINIFLGNFENAKISKSVYEPALKDLAYRLQNRLGYYVNFYGNSFTTNVCPDEADLLIIEWYLNDLLEDLRKKKTLDVS